MILLAKFTIGATTLYLSTEDVVISGQQYQSAIIETPSLTRSLQDLYWGVVQSQSLTLKSPLSWAPGSAWSSYANTLINAGVSLSRWDGSTEFFLGYGTVESYNMLDAVEISVALGKHAEMQTMLPLRVYKDDDFAADRPTSITKLKPAGDLGKAYPLIFGQAKKVPLLYVYCNYTDNWYDYIIGYGPIAGIDAVYRNHVVVSSGYTLMQDTRYDGMAYLRFTSEQKDTNGALYTITADVRGLTMGGASEQRNPASIVQNILSAAWGLGKTIDATTFSTAVTQSVNFYCDGAITQQRRAQDLLNDILIINRGSLDKNASGAWTISCDIQDDAGASAATFASGDGHYENIVSIDENSTIPSSERIKKHIIKCRTNLWQGQFSTTIERSVNSDGEDKTLELPFVRDWTTANRMSQYAANMATLAHRRITITVGSEGQSLQRGQRITVTVSRLGISGDWIIDSITYGRGKYQIKAHAYNAAVYTYTVETVPASEAADSMTDYSETAPAVPIAPTVTSTSTAQGSDGKTTANLTLTSTAPSANFSRMTFGYRKTGDSYFTYTDGSGTGAGATWTGSINGLIAGQQYQLVATAWNSAGKISATSLITTQLAPGDTTAPANVGTVTGTAKYKTWTFAWAAVADKDVRGYSVQIATDAGFASIVYNGEVRGNTVTWTSDGVSYGTLYCRVKAIDYTGNLSAAWSTSGSATGSTIGETDISTGAVTNLKVASDLSADKISAGVLYVGETANCRCAIGGTVVGGVRTRDGRAHFYNASNNEQISIGAATSPLGGTVGMYIDTTVAGNAMASGLHTKQNSIFVGNQFDNAGGTALLCNNSGANTVAALKGAASQTGTGVEGTSSTGVGGKFSTGNNYALQATNNSATQASVIGTNSGGGPSVYASTFVDSVQAYRQNGTVGVSGTFDALRAGSTTLFCRITVQGGIITAITNI